MSGQGFGGGVRSVVAVQVELAEADHKCVVLKKLRPARLPSPGSPVLVAGRVLGVAEIALPRLSTVPVPETFVPSKWMLFVKKSFGGGAADIGKNADRSKTMETNTTRHPEALAFILNPAWMLASACRTVKQFGRLEGSWLSVRLSDLKDWRRLDLQGCRPVFRLATRERHDTGHLRTPRLRPVFQLSSFMRLRISVP